MQRYQNIFYSKQIRTATAANKHWCYFDVDPIGVSVGSGLTLSL